ncbi:hypothetical protein VPH35_057712 [Triticum aestivum]
MQYNGPTYRFPPTVPERLYSAGVYVERTLRVWAISRWRGARELTEFFLAAGFRHLPRGSPRMYHLEEVNHNGIVVGLLATFTNPFDAFHLLGRAYWVGCEFIAFTTYNIFTDFNGIFPNNGVMHTLPYPINNGEE